jgi:predicted nucleotidyltransferase
MAAVPATLTKNIDLFLSIVRQRYRITAVYLYGSLVKQTGTVWSDIDLAIISPDFSADLFQEQVRLLRLAAQIDDRIEPRPFRPADFDPTEPLVSEIIRTGVQVA